MRGYDAKARRDIALRECVAVAPYEASAEVARTKERVSMDSKRVDKREKWSRYGEREAVLTRL